MEKTRSFSALNILFNTVLRSVLFGASLSADIAFPVNFLSESDDLKFYWKNGVEILKLFTARIGKQAMFMHRKSLLRSEVS